MAIKSSQTPTKYGEIIVDERKTTKQSSDRDDANGAESEGLGVANTKEEVPPSAATLEDQQDGLLAAAAEEAFTASGEGPAKPSLPPRAVAFGKPNRPISFSRRISVPRVYSIAEESAIENHTDSSKQHFGSDEQFIWQYPHNPVNCTPGNYPVISNDTKIYNIPQYQLVPPKRPIAGTLPSQLRISLLSDDDLISQYLHKPFRRSSGIHSIATNDHMSAKRASSIYPGISNDPIFALPEPPEFTIKDENVEKSNTGESSGQIEGPPDGRYGWVCVGCCFAVNSCTWGINSAFGVYLANYLSANLHPSATPMDYAFIGGIAVSAPMLVAPQTTFLFRHGWTTQGIMGLGILFLTSGLLAASFTFHSLISLFFTQGLLCGLGVGFLFTSSAGVISQWFQRKRSVANAIASAGTGLGGLAFSLGTNAMIEKLSLAWAFRITAIVTFGVNSIATMLLRDRNNAIRPPQNPLDLSLFKNVPEFSLVLLWAFFGLFGYIVIVFSLPDYAQTIGLSAKQGSIMSSMLSLGMMFGRPLIGWLSDQYGRINISALASFISALSVFCVWMIGHLGGFWICVVFAVLNGAVCGTFWSTVSPITTEVVGLKNLPSALSIVWLSVVVPSASAEAIALLLRRPKLRHVGIKSDAEYLYPQIFAGTMYLAAAISLFILRVNVMRKLTKKEQETQSLDSNEIRDEDGGIWRKFRLWLRWAKI